MHVTPDWNLFSRLAGVRQQHYADVTRYAEEALRGQIDRLRLEFGVRAEGEIQLGGASETISRAASAFQPHLLIMGARGEHSPAIAPAALGGTALKLITHSSQPLLLVRSADPSAYKSSLAAISEPHDLSKRIIRWGTFLVPHGACHVIRAYDVPYLERLRECGVGEDAFAACIDGALKSAQHATDAVLGDTAVSAHIHVRLVRGEALTVILEEMNRDGVQIVVVGKHDHRPDQSAHALIGSIGVRVAYHAPIDVLIVP
jgi:nucleotide-binding universal stress UspA family protein